MILSFAIRQRAHAAGLQSWVERFAAGSREPEDLRVLAEAPLPLVAALAAAVTPEEASIRGLLPVPLLADVGETEAAALAHPAAAEAECVELSVRAPCALGALDQACEVASRLLAKLRGASARIDLASLEALAHGAGLPLAGAAGRLAAAGVTEILAPADAVGEDFAVGPLPLLQRWQAPATIDDAFFEALLAGPRRPVIFEEPNDATGILLLRAVATARLLGHGPITVRARGELKGPDACLAFGADSLEVSLDPPGTMGSRTRAYGESAIRGAQRRLAPPARRAEGRKVAHILDERVDPSLLPGGGAPERLEVLP